MIEFVVALVILALLLRLSRQVSLQERRILGLEAMLARVPSAATEAADAPTPGPSSPEERRSTPPEPGQSAEEQAPSRIDPPQPGPVPGGTVPVTGPAPPGRSAGFEEALGTRWAVWVGGLALALGGIFLVRYSIEQELIGPGTRVALGLVFALALIAAGEWLRRRDEPLAIAAFRSANVPAILTAAGTSTAFATVFAAYGLYGLIGPGLAFVALGAIAFVTMAAAALHGPALAGLGLVAALASPLLVEAPDPSPFGLVLYLVFAVGAAYGVARLKLWRPLAIAAATGALLWGGLFLVEGESWAAAAMAHVVVQLALALLFLVIDVHRRTPEGEAVTDGLVASIVVAFALLAVLVTLNLGGGFGRPLFVGVVAAMLTAVAVLYPAAGTSAAAAALAVVSTLALWPVESEAAAEPLRVIRDLPSAPRPEAIGAFLTSALVLTTVVAGPSLWRVSVGPGLRTGIAAWYVGAATIGPIAALIAAYWRVTDFDGSVPFALAAAALAAGYAALAGALTRHPAAAAPALRLATGAVAAAAVAALAAGLTFAFDRGVLTVALALSALGTAWVADQSRIPALRWVVGALGLAVAARFAWDPTIMRGEIGRTPIFNWLLWGYGVPALAFGLSARILARTGRDAVVRLAQSLAILFSALLVFLEIRHALNDGDPFAPTSGHLEAGLVVTEALAFTLLMTRLDLRRPDPLYRVASLLFGALSLAGAAVALGLVYNPYLFGGPVVGGPVLNSLIPAYLIPAALAAALAVAARSSRPLWFALSAAALALALELAYSLLEVRVLFQGPQIDLFRSTSEAELWCYSLVLIANAIALLAAGFVWRSRVARLASLGLFVATILKVFLVDLSALEGLLRAVSFVGLGLALVGTGLAYQRLLARRGPA